MCLLDHRVGVPILIQFIQMLLNIGTVDYLILNQIPQVRDSLSSKLRCCIGGVFLLS